MPEVGDIEAGESDVIETIQRMVAMTEVSSVMVIFPKETLDAYVQETGDDRPPDSMDYLELKLRLVGGQEIAALLMLGQVKDLTHSMLTWHKDMHDAGKCDHD